MRRVCFLGNSHLAAVKVGLQMAEEQGVLGGLEYDAFGSPGHSIVGSFVDRGHVMPASDLVAESFAVTSGGQRSLDIERYDDIYLIFGRSPFSIPLYLPAGLLPPPSPRVFRAIAAAWSESWAVTLARAIDAAATRAKIHFVGQPESAGGRRRSAWLRAIRGQEGEPDPSALSRLSLIRTEIAKAVAATTHPFSSIATFPPACLDEYGLFTRPEFCRGAPRLRPSSAQTKPDVIHMNGEYGLELLRHLGLARR